MSAHCDTCGHSLAWVGDEMWCDYCEVVAERDRLVQAVEAVIASGSVRVTQESADLLDALRAVKGEQT